MPHARSQIRDAVVTAVTGLTTTGSNVFASRVYPHATLPSLAVYTVAESVQDEEGTLGTKQHRALEVIVEARAKAAAAATLDDTLDTIAAEVEAALVADRTLGGLAKWTEYQEAEIELDAEAEQPVGLARLTFAVIYRVDGTDPTAIIP